MKILLLGLLLCASALPAGASTMGARDRTCPVCLADFYQRVQISATGSDTGLDFRPLGAILTPSPLPVCQECGFVVLASSASSRNLTAWRATAASPEYSAIKSRSAHYRKAFLYGKLGFGDRGDVGGLYLKASWEEEEEPAKVKEDLELALANFDAYLAEAAENSVEWGFTHYLRAELLRRLSRFDEAERALARLRGIKFPGTGLGRFIKYQRKLCLRKDPAPRGIGEMKKESFFRSIGDFFRRLF
ncbi:MAG: hypothetical protein Q8O90_13055 [Elusimicrobiota bacterium]|nr:hypothetical protein [Elusimicrobiota bacterium]